MKDFRQAAQKWTSAGQAISSRSLAQQFSMTAPISLARLTNMLSPETVILSSGDLGPSTVTGWAQLGLQSNGYWSYRGHVRESGALGHNYVFGVALQGFTNAAGATFIT